MPAHKAGKRRANLGMAVVKALPADRAPAVQWRAAMAAGARVCEVCVRGAGAGTHTYSRSAAAPHGPNVLNTHSAP